MQLTSYVNEFRQNFRIADAVDVVVIAVLLYAAIVWFKRTTSRSVVIGVLVVVCLYLLARMFDMYLTLLVFHASFTVLLIVLVVLFQEEIRRGFERLAGWGSLRDLSPRTTALVAEVDALVEAAYAMAAGRIGALIVLGGREPLGRHIHGGIELSGRITRPILYSIFDPSSAGHDGAVIIANDRIERFGVHLPISTNRQVIGGRGTRHAAALGLSERSDSLTIVVSEERGVVSVARHGGLSEIETAADLKRHLEQFLEDCFPQRLQATWIRFVTHDVRGKLLALGFAVLAWFVLAFSVDKIQTSVVVPIQYRNVPEQAQVDESTPADALVTLSGTERDFRLFDRRVMKILIDLGGVVNGDEIIPITAANVRQPPNLKVDRIQPQGIRVRLKSPPPNAPPPNSPQPTTPSSEAAGARP